MKKQEAENTCPTPDVPAIELVDIVAGYGDNLVLDGVNLAVKCGEIFTVIGLSGSGKSTVARHFVEAILEQGYQFCLLDPEGDYEACDGAVVLGGPKALPQVDEVLHLLENPDANAVICLTGMSIPDRPPFFLGLLSQLLEMRSRTGHPHWLILDETHHLMPAEWLPPAGSIPEQLHNTLLITVQPNLLAAGLLQRVNTVIAIGRERSVPR